MQALSEALDRIESAADTTSARTRTWAVTSLVAAVVAWSIGLRALVWDSASTVLRWSPLLVVLFIPGLMLLGFGRRASTLSLVPDRVREQLGPAVAGTGKAIAEVRSKGIGLRPLIGALMSLRDEGGDIARVAAEVTGSVRLLNPLYLGIVGLSSLASAFVFGAAVIAVVTLLI
ncbi:hypothetical protein HQ535_14640, partial [bacterium]|nr:hypothetical protein [bacterium]